MKFDSDSLSHRGIYRGKVLDNIDSMKKGRVKVEILGIFTGIEKEYLPWAVPGLPIFCGAGVGFGSFGVPAIDSWVWCFFEEGDHQQPVYFAEAPDGVHGFPAAGEDTYPNSRGWVTPAGHKLVLDDEGAITIYHKDGATVVLDTSSIILSVGSTSITMNGTTVNMGT